jgi:protocatechuate 3,4-dioxygenase beta subunit
MRLLFLFAAILFLANIGCTQNTTASNQFVPDKGVRAHCEGCEAINESPIPFSQLPSSDTLPGFNEKGTKLLVYGTVYKNDGRTPAPDIVLYVYHTDQKGVYPKKGNETGWAQRHGYIRAWVKTGANGAYSFYTLKPAAYPERNFAAHIHIIIKEPGKTPYWIDEYVFDDDLLLSKEQRSQAQNKGGSGILHLTSKGDLLIGKRNIILGKNIENY